MQGFAFDPDCGDDILQAFDPEQAGLLLGDHQHMAANMETRCGAQGCASSHSELLEPTRMIGGGGEEDGSSASRCTGEDGMFSLEWGSEAAENGPGEMAMAMKEDILGSLDFADDEIKIPHDDNAEHFADDRYVRSSGTSSGSSPRSEEGGGTQMEGESKEDKKRRNRVAARVCRAKKKQTIAALQSGHEELLTKYDRVCRENESLRSVNAALERQVTYFQSLFKTSLSSIGGEKPLLPFSSDDIASPPASQQGTASVAITSSGCALAVAFFFANHNVRIVQEESLPRRTTSEQWRGSGRALLSLALPDDDDQPDDQQGIHLSQPITKMLLQCAFVAVLVVLALAIASHVRRAKRSTGTGTGTGSSLDDKDQAPMLQTVFSTGATRQFWSLCWADLLCPVTSMMLPI